MRALWVAFIGACVLGIPFTLWYVQFRQHYSFYLQDNGYISLIANGMDLFIVLFSFAFGGLWTYGIYEWIKERRLKHG